MGGWGQGECEQRIEVFVKMQKKIWGSGGSGGQGGCERRSEVIVKFQKKKNRGWVGQGWGLEHLVGVRVDVNEELKLLCKSTKKSGPG